MAKEKYLKNCGGIKPLPLEPMREDDKDPSKPIIVDVNDFSTEEIDKLFETVPPGAVFTGTGYNPEKEKEIMAKRKMIDDRQMAEFIERNWEEYQKAQAEKKETTLKRVRSSKGFTQKSLSEATGISLRTIQHWECGNSDFNQAAAMTVYKVSRVLGVEMIDLMDIPEELK